jgi:hemerythrin
MQKIVWGPNLETGIEKIDFQHQKLVAMVGELADCVTEPNLEVRETMIRIFLEQLLQYTVHHFQFEEELMEKAGYKDFSNHKKNHENLKKKVLDLQTRFLNKEDVTTQLMQFITAWLQEHIQGEDKKYVTDVKKLGPIY